MVREKIYSRWIQAVAAGAVMFQVACNSSSIENKKLVAAPVATVQPQPAKVQNSDVVNVVATTSKNPSPTERTRLRKKQFSPNTSIEIPAAKEEEKSEKARRPRRVASAEQEVVTEQDIVTPSPSPSPSPDPKADLSLEPSVSAAAVPSSEPMSTGLVRDFWVWAGLGVNFTSYTQSMPGMSDVNFGRIKSPSTMFRTGFFISDHLGLDLGYKDTPGEAASSDTLSVTNGSYNWKTLSSEIIFRPAADGEGRSSEWLWRFGLQHHQMPFIVPLTLNSLAIKENTMTAGSVGFEYRYLTKKRVRIEYMLRYQQPFSGASEAGTSFTLRPKLTFDGSVGAAYEIRPNLFIGSYWYGQYHSYSFDYQNSSGTTFSGEQNLFFSNFDLRLGLEF